MSAQNKTTAKVRNTKVRNTKFQAKTGKNEISESQLKVVSVPLFSPKDGKARLTFIGVEHTTNKDEKPVMRIVFSVLDETHESPINIGIRCDYKISEKNKLGKILTAMGYEIKKSTEVVDSDDEYGMKTTIVNPREIFDFFRSKCGLVFKANLEPVFKTNQKEEIYKTGLWDILPKSLEPLMKNGEQLRDMLASDVSDEEFENPEIAMSDED